MRTTMIPGVSSVFGDGYGRRGPPHGDGYGDGLVYGEDGNGYGDGEHASMDGDGRGRISSRNRLARGVFVPLTEDEVGTG